MIRRIGVSMNNPLWDYSLATYSRDGVAQTCLQLQDTYGMDVNLLLYAAWLAQKERYLSRDHLLEVDALIADWRNNVVRPLRALRRYLHAEPPADGIIDEIKTLELRAEQQQQDRMYAFQQRAAVLPRAARPLQENLVQVAQLFSPENSGWASGLAHLVALLSP
ncbi:MAG TPA: TIGR02444 family protein [Halioglobus sp.]